MQCNLCNAMYGIAVIYIHVLDSATDDSRGDNSKIVYRYIVSNDEDDEVSIRKDCKDMKPPMV